MVAALQDAQRRRVGADRGVGREHRRVHGVGVPEGGRRAALHQPPQARPPRRPHRGQGEPHPGRPQRPGTIKHNFIPARNKIAPSPIGWFIVQIPFCFRTEFIAQNKDQLIKKLIKESLTICNLISQLLHVEGMVKIPGWLGVRRSKREDSKSVGCGKDELHKFDNSV